MIKTGIYHIEDLTDLKKTRSLFGRLRRVSITLYDQVKSVENGDAWAQHILLLFSDGRGVYKRTYSRRFEEFDSLCISHIAEAFDARATLYVHDAAVSDGRTACDFFYKLAAYNPNITYFASDYDPTLKIIESGNRKVTLDSRNQPLEIVFPPFVFNLVRTENFLIYPINYLFFLYASKLYLPHIMYLYVSGEIKAKEIEIFSPEAAKLAESDHRFNLMAYDLLESSTLNRSMQIVRVMNVLNSCYFNTEQLRNVVHNLFHALVDGGLLIVGSNGDIGTPVQGSIYKRSENRFYMIAQAGQSHYAHHAILEYRS
jgi:hypothetical protein